MGQETGFVTVEEVLPLIPGSRVVAGAAGLGRVVRSVSVMETPDGAGFTRPGDVVLTALYAFRDDPGAQTRLVAELDARGIAALAVKRSYVTSFPEGMLAEAERLQLPLLALPPDVSYSDTVRAILTHIVNRQAAVLQRQHEVYRVMIKAVLEQQGLPALAQNLAELLGDPVAIADVHGELLAWAVPAGTDASGVPERLHALLRTRACSADVLISEAGVMHRREAVVLGGQRLSRVVTPVATGGQAYGAVLVWELGRPVAHTDLIVLDTAATVVALEFVNRRALLEVERRYSSEFLVSLCASDPDEGAQQLLIRRARSFGLDLTRPHYVIAVRTLPPAGDPEAQVLLDRLYDAVQRAVAGEGFVGEHDSCVVLIFPALAEDARNEALGRAERLVEGMRPLLSRVRVTVGVGGAYAGAEGVRRSYREARKAVAIAERVWGPGGVVHFDDLGVYTVLDAAMASEQLERFLAGVRSLVEYDQAHGTELVRTLEAFFAHNGSVRRVAAALYLHYNTVLYRLERIQQLTGMDLKDPDCRLSLQIALKAARLTGLLPAARARSAHPA